MYLFILIFAIFAFDLSAKEIDLGIDKFNKKEYEQAYNIFHSLAKKNHAQAQYYLALMYFEGSHVKINYEEGFKWLQKSAENEDANAQYCLAIFLHGGKYIKKDELKAIEWLQKAAKNGSPNANILLASLYIHGDKYLAKNVQKGFDILKDEILLNYNHKAYLLLGLYYITGRYVPQNFRRGFFLIDHAAKAGISEAIYWRGRLLLNGIGCDMDKKHGLADINSAANMNNSNAIDYLDKKKQKERNMLDDLRSYIENLFSYMITP